MNERQQQSSMQHGVAQWLAEIRLLQNQLATARQERDESLKSAANWRQLYETEAKQRRTDTALKQQQIDQLQAELAQYHGHHHNGSQGSQPDGQARSQLELEQSLAHLSDTDLKQRLIEALQDCDRLRQTLQKERDEHSQTRKSLTSALGDAVDQLTRARQLNHSVGANNSVATHSSSSDQSAE